MIRFFYRGRSGALFVLRASEVSDPQATAAFLSDLLFGAAVTWDRV